MNNILKEIALEIAQNFTTQFLFWGTMITFTIVIILDEIDKRKK